MFKEVGVFREEHFEGRVAISEVKFNHIHSPCLTTVSIVYNVRITVFLEEFLCLTTGFS